MGRFVHSIHAVVFFGREFGDIIRPAVEVDGRCPEWETLPRHRYYLAASIYDVRNITKDFGNPWTDPPEPVRGLI
jgi:hypothetical protein